MHSDSFSRLEVRGEAADPPSPEKKKISAFLTRDRGKGGPSRALAAFPAATRDKEWREAVSMSKEATVVILDVGESMGTERDGESRLERAKRMVQMLVTAKILHGGKRDRLALVKFGTELTQNSLHEDYIE